MTSEKKPSPIEFEFETEEQAESYDRWFRRKVEAAPKDDRPRVPHDEVMAEMDRIIDSAAASKTHERPAERAVAALDGVGAARSSANRQIYLGKQSAGRARPQASR